jgi:hypothetical protein
VLTVGGLVLFFAAPKTAKATANGSHGRAVAVAPAVAPGQFGLSLSGGF